jgi:hypothetical protein
MHYLGFLYCLYLLHAQNKYILITCIIHIILHIRSIPYPYHTTTIIAGFNPRTKWPRLTKLLVARLRGVVLNDCPFKLLLLRLPAMGDGTGGGTLLRTAGGGGARRRCETVDGADQDLRRAEVDAAQGERLREPPKLQPPPPPKRRRAESRRSGSQLSVCSL